ncbi:shikimate dehydrogenase family protein [Aquibaculum arenosum]|uniref:shikimate dehydrogenase (NADP(+)) n=1 Tax=Aquibaculum arenosum TaxID=3032591 RepID=A0ABT5YRD1_9PROT|nr:shikimate dehydrogenase [Fodinicurvata sp. CAU 1616]MDF2097300.1 shikimate dehydrogenase [Fodinicurvata sp. CAU 1616]
MNITGRTRVYGIIADPIQHVKAPEVMHPVFERHGVDGVLIPIHVSPEGLPELMQGLRRMQNFGGFVATVPHKPAMVALCDEVDEQARLIGAANIVRREPDGRLVGAMLDGIGFVTGLRQVGVEPAGMRVWLCGAGGAASAIAFALAKAEVAQITIANRSRDKAEDLARRVRDAYPKVTATADTADFEGHDLVVNGTSLGMRAEDPAPVDFARLHAGQVVAEVIMQPAKTPLLLAAEAAGCRIQPGAPMLACQIELMAQHMGAI